MRDATVDLGDYPRQCWLCPASEADNIPVADVDIPAGMSLVVAYLCRDCEHWRWDDAVAKATELRGAPPAVPRRVVCGVCGSSASCDCGRWEPFDPAADEQRKRVA